MRKVPAFTTRNDTAQWAVIIDGLFALYPTREQAMAVYDAIGGQDSDDGLADTAFGSAQLLPPGYLPRNQLLPGSPSMATAKLSDTLSHQADLANYVRVHPGRQCVRAELSAIREQNETTASDRLKWERSWDFLFAAE